MKNSLSKDLLDLEKVLFRLSEHDLQWGDVLFLVWGWLMVHNPEAREEYIEGGHPEFYYGYPRKKEHARIHNKDVFDYFDRDPDILSNDESSKEKRSSRKAKV